ncbi:allantoinase [Kwoniella bestiolae CBS 10118]|uniref:allantoinase n=1 Tax=Kwoniella bestiolae CBS 10118 TaxID=1296100 RepID=A0A1B9G590_9TREE|nr:allantoinase [Kwoniella bestiolae CBS 10118]OCF26197.1 allantoinase [Kwoniella bestiolae CBS 10118]
MSKQIILAPLAILPGNHKPQPATIEIDLQSGVIASIQKGLVPPEDKGVDVIQIEEGKVVLPGLVDTHVHLNQPGRTEWEGFQTGTLAAISGGVTTVIDMPLNSIPPTTTLEGLEVKRTEAEKVGVNCDIGFWGGIIPGNAGELVGMLQEGVKGFKCFLIESGVEEFPCVDEEDLLKACEALKDTNALILFHAELDSAPHAHDEPSSSSDPNEYSTFLSSRPEEWELSALSLILKIAKLYPSLRFHIVHLSAASALPAIRQARSEGVNNLTIETCFHYLCLASEEIPDNATQFKCCPPIRDSSNRLQLKQALLDGEIDYVVSDHSPCVPELKKGDFLNSWGGISGLGLGLSLLWTEFRDDQVELGKIVDWMGSVQAKQVGLEDKGGLKVGNKADWIVFDPKKEWDVTLGSLLFKNKVSPYVGKTLRGLVEKTYLSGRLVWDHSKGVEGVAYSQGKLL